MTFFRYAKVFQDCTFFTRKDILRLYKRFYTLNPVKVPTNMQGTRPSIITLCFEEIEKMPELKVKILKYVQMKIGKVKLKFLKKINKNNKKQKLHS